MFGEKPLAITCEQLEAVKSAHAAAAGGEGGPPQLHVGFNRRFASHVRTMKLLLDAESAPKALTITVNAGKADTHHWITDPDVGGGRIIGEGCHFVDLLRFLTGKRIAELKWVFLGKVPGAQVSADNATITMSFADGSVGTVHYWANGNRAYPKERLEAFVKGKVLVLENYRKLKAYGWRGFRDKRCWLAQDKGHKAEVREFISRVRDGGQPLIPFEELAEVAQVCLSLVPGSDKSEKQGAGRRCFATGTAPGLPGMLVSRARPKTRSAVE